MKWQKQSALVLGLIAVLLLGAAVQAQEQIVIRYTDIAYSGATEGLLKGFAEEYMAENPNVTVEVEIPPLDTYRETLVTRYAAGQGPELAGVATSWVPEFSDAIIPLDDLVNEEFSSRFYEKVWAASFYKGQLYGIPHAVSTRALFYRPDVFEAAGVEPPTTWDDLYAAAQAIRAADPDMAPFALRGGGEASECFYSFMQFVWSNGGDMYDADGNFTLNSPEALEALEFLVQFVKDGGTQSEPWATDFMQAIELYTGGTAAMHIDGPWVMNMSDAASVPYGVVPAPYKTTPYALMVTDSLIIAQTAENPEAVMDFVKSMYTAERAATWNTTEGFIPTMKETAEDAYYDTEGWKLFIDQLDVAKFYPERKDASRLQQETCTQLQATLREEITPQQALDTIEANYTPFMEE